MQSQLINQEAVKVFDPLSLCLSINVQSWDIVEGLHILDVILRTLLYLKKKHLITKFIV